MDSVLGIDVTTTEVQVVDTMRLKLLPLLLAVSTLYVLQVYILVVLLNV